MLPLGLTRPELRAFHRALTDHHSIRVRVYVLNMEHEVVGRLTEEILDGQVNVDTNADAATRSATISFLDRRRTLDFDSDSPANGALFANRMLRIIYGVRVPELGEWINVPIFTGPITKLDREDDVVNVEAQGKETLALAAAWRPMQIRKHVRKVDAIERILRERVGETRFDLADLGARLPNRVSLGRESQPWAAAQKIARSLDRQLFYDGRGVVRLRRHPGRPAFRFTDGPGGSLLTTPQVAFSVDEVINAVWVKGGVPKSKKKDDTPAQDDQKKDRERGVRYFETAPRSHPLSPWRLGMNGEPRYLLEVLENDAIRSEKEAREAARSLLRRRLRQLVEVSFDALPVPHLEPGDLIRVDSELFAMTVPVRQFSIPLRHDQPQSMGYLRRPDLRRGRRRRRNRR